MKCCPKLHLKRVAREVTTCLELLGAFSDLQAQSYYAVPGDLAVQKEMVKIRDKRGAFTS